MRRVDGGKSKRGTVLVLIVGLLAMLFMLVTAYITLARFDRLTLDDARKGEQLDQVLTSLNDMLMAQLTQMSAIPGASVSGEAYDAIPGYRNGSWISALEPVRKRLSSTPTGTWPEDYEYPAVSSLTGAGTGKKALTDMMRDDDHLDGIVVDPANPGATPDTRSNARNPRSDADGDGIPDTSFQHVARATEMVNAAAGASVTADFDPTQITWGDDSDREYRAWLHFDEQALYEAAVRVVSHGGLVQIALPDEPAYDGQRHFLYSMFNWIMHPGDPTGGGLLGTEEDDPNMLAQTWTQRDVIEPLLRARGGLLLGAAGVESLPPALRWWQEIRFRHTFDPQYSDPVYHGGFEKDTWQRFNLAAAESVPFNKCDWEAWRQGVSLDADLYNEVAVLGSAVSPDPRNLYVRRRLLTTINNSDEVAREQSKTLTNPPTQENANLGIDAGQLKYYLGRITDTREKGGVPLGAFWPDGRFNDTTPLPDSSTPRGFEVVAELAAYFHEMLSAYSDWSDQAVSRRQQAYMLAVNTVAFAAPRMAPSGWIDTVYYANGSGTVYYGYTPQPFITHVVAYNRVEAPEDPNDPVPPGAIALAVELYNPNDTPNTGPIGASIDLSQYFISLNDQADPPDGSLNPLMMRSLGAGYLTELGSPPLLVDRGFTVFAVHGNDPNDGLADNGFFEAEKAAGRFPQMAGAIDTLGVPSMGDIVVKLWKVYDAAGTQAYCLVDRFEVDVSGKLSDREWWVSAERDCQADEQLGVRAGVAPARWRMCVGYQKNDSDEYQTAFRDAQAADPGDPEEPPTTLLDRLGYATPPAGVEERFGPTVPLCTMNPDLGTPTDPATITIHGTKRPAAFPTVGFMLFVPRFSHMYAGLEGLPKRWPMSELLREQWTEPDLTMNTVPADFGHMPVFENKQKIVGDAAISPPSGFRDNRAGRVPWGLLVYDYFTTLNPDGQDGQPDTGDELDPYRIPGRININAAPWFVLAGLPVIGPPYGVDLDGYVGPDLPLKTLDSGALSNISPAFWSSEAGILTGYGGIGTPRSITWTSGSNWATTPARLYYDATATYGATAGSWRLGPYLAQAAAAYRDRIQYALSTTTPAVLAQAHQRNSGYAYRGSRYEGTGDSTKYRGGIRRKDKKGNDCRGFLTLGELANVAGFDSSSEAELASSTTTVLAEGAPPDFFRAISLMALLDTHFLTTRSNTYTIYTALFDRQNPQASMRSQVTVDRSRLVPRLVEQPDTDGDGVPDKFITLQDSGPPEIIGRRKVGYFNARYDN